MAFSADFVKRNAIRSHEDRVKAGIALIEKVLADAKEKNPHGTITIMVPGELGKQSIQVDVLRLVKESLERQLGMTEASKFSYPMVYGEFCLWLSDVDLGTGEPRAGQTK